MACTEPLLAYKSHALKTENGKAVISFNEEAINHYPYESLELPCGKCKGCRLSHAKQWAVRCVHEALNHDKSSFITLTFNEQYHGTKRHDCRKCERYKRTQVLCSSISLCHRDFTLFMKRLRKRIAKHSNTKIRYFHVGEYGSQLGRPHHHAIIFGWDFPDKRIWKTTKSKETIYRSPMLEEEWIYGYSSVGNLTWKSAAYCARYALKKVGGDYAEQHYRKVDKETGEVCQLNPEYVTMSRRPGIARDFIREFHEDVYPQDCIHILNKVFKTPRYYDKEYDLIDPEAMKKIKQKRLTKAKEQAKKDSPVNRRRMQRIINNATAERLEREIEK